MASLAGLVDEVVSDWNGRLVETAVFATSDPDEIANLIDGFCGAVLGARVGSGLFYFSSVGCVAGVSLRNGRSVGVKAYQPRWDATFLSAVTRVQQHLVDSGFPCPRPLAGPGPLGAGMALVEQFLADPGNRTLGRAERRASATGLATVITDCEDIDAHGLSPHPLDTPREGLYGTPHHPMFDFTATTDGAEWIDQLARVAIDQRDTADPRRVIAHTDWSARNVRLRPQGVIAAYDWDSLAVVAETTAVGQAAATWSSCDADDPSLAPGVEEVAAYVRDYEAARGRTFTDFERDCVGAAALWVLAYTARCEHALWLSGSAPQRASDRLQMDGDALLRLSRTMK